MAERINQSARPTLGRLLDETRYFSPEKNLDLITERREENKPQALKDLFQYTSNQLTRNALRSGLIVVDLISLLKTSACLVTNRASLSDVQRDFTFLAKDMVRSYTTNLQLALSIIGSLGEMWDAKAGLSILLLVEMIDSSFDDWIGGNALPEMKVSYAVDYPIFSSVDSPQPTLEMDLVNDSTPSKNCFQEEVEQEPGSTNFEFPQPLSVEEELEFSEWMSDCENEIESDTSSEYSDIESDTSSECSDDFDEWEDDINTTRKEYSEPFGELPKGENYISVNNSDLYDSEVSFDPYPENALDILSSFTPESRLEY